MTNLEATAPHFPAREGRVPQRPVRRRLRAQKRRHRRLRPPGDDTELALVLPPPRSPPMPRPHLLPRSTPAGAPRNASTNCSSSVAGVVLTSTAISPLAAVGSLRFAVPPFPPSSQSSSSFEQRRRRRTTRITAAIGADDDKTRSGEMAGCRRRGVTQTGLRGVVRHRWPSAATSADGPSGAVFAPG